MKWIVSNSLVDYEEAVEKMESTVEDINKGNEEETVWLLEHPPLYTAGTSANDKDLLTDKLPVYKTGRGGQYTYHGPGQRIAYVMLNLRERQKSPDVRKYVQDLEDWIIKTIDAIELKGEIREGKVGIWVHSGVGTVNNFEWNKVAAIGVRIRKWVTFHGIAINICNDLSNYSGIVPCGISEDGVTSVSELLGENKEVTFLDEILKAKFEEVF